MTLIRTTIQRALELVLPARCVGCGKAKTYLCDSCIETMDVPLERTIVRNDYAFTTATAAVIYDSVARDVVHRFKFKNLRALSPFMAEPKVRMMSTPLNLDVIVAVPLHGSRLRERGYNQAALLSKDIAALTQIPFEPTWLTRTRRSGRQVEAEDVVARRANVRSAFLASTAVAGLRVALVDDVMTTGATLGPAAAALKSAGAAEVHCYTFARDM
jgi:ComF family protein